jgi:hypothetical protein
MVENDYAALVKSRPVAQWKETLAVLATYTAPEQWATLCDALAARLAQAGMNHAASLCYICAGNVDQTVAYWTKASQAATAAVGALQVRRAPASHIISPICLLTTAFSYDLTGWQAYRSGPAAYDAWSTSPDLPAVLCCAAGRDREVCRDGPGHQQPQGQPLAVRPGHALRCHAGGPGQAVHFHGVPGHGGWQAGGAVHGTHGGMCCMLPFGGYASRKQQHTSLAMSRTV